LGALSIRCEVSELKTRRSGTGKRANATPSLPTSEKDSLVAEINYRETNGEDRAIFPMFREMIGKVRAGWIVFVVLVSAVTHFGSILISNGWLATPAKSIDLDSFKHEVSSQLDGIRHDHAEFKGLLTDLQRANTETVLRLTAIAATLAERNGTGPVVVYTPAGVLPVTPKRPKPVKIDPPAETSGNWITKQFGH
jgi:hypothetical protein